MIAHAGPVPVEELAPLVAAGGWMIAAAARVCCGRFFRRR
jgi:hypothetical protein